MNKTCYLLVNNDSRTITLLNTNDNYADINEKQMQINLVTHLVICKLFTFIMNTIRLLAKMYQLAFILRKNHIF